ncbi:MAG: hypothetical protein JWQ75_777 [Pseudarthrobacter sp.]|nr:hypothetical protein [Pseudarthrobacter sp.]
MRRILRTLIAVLALLAAAPLAAVAAHAVPAVASAPAQPQVLATVTQDAGAPAAMLASTTSPSPTDPASTGPANPGTGETGDAEATRVDYAPWVIGAVALITLAVVLIWRRRRNTTIV